jgi:hypothetical protein
MNSIPTKNGLPWTSVFKLPEPVNPELLAELKTLWESIDWGKNYENNRRKPDQLAIYPCTRKVTYNTSCEYDDKRLGILAERFANELKKFFPIPMRLLWSELTLLIPKGEVHWHHDRMVTGTFATRVMIPITDNDDIKYYFCSWNKKTPTNASMFYAREYLSSDIHEVEMTTGNYYTFNHRIPHKTISKSPLPRGILMIEMIPLSDYDENWDESYGPITEFEKTPIILPNKI